MKSKAEGTWVYLIDEFLNFLFPARIVMSTPYFQAWKQRERNNYRSYSVYIFLILAIVHIFHYFLIDFTLHLNPLSYWILFRTGSVVLSICSVLYSSSPLYRRYSGNKAPFFISVLFMMICQACSFKWDSRVPWFFSALIPLLGIWILHLSLFSSLVLLVLVFYFQFPILTEVLLTSDPTITQSLLSIDIVAVFFLVSAKGADKYKVKNFINEMIQAELNKNLTEVRNQQEFEIARQTQEIRKNAEEATRLKLSASLGEMASQIAHDIRSPLAALNMVLQDVRELPEDKRTLLRSVAQRITDIANLLVKHSKMSRPVHSENGLSPDPSRGLGQNQGGLKQVVLLSSTIDEVITEKRTQYRSRMEVRIQFRFDENSYGLFAEINETELKRILSNVINNSVEAFVDGGDVTLSLTATQNLVLIRIEDTGKGIPLDVLPHLGRKGATFGKADGSGLGLSHALNHIEKWGGSLEINSQEGKGTCLSIKVPKAKAPNWFIERITLIPNSYLVVLDDDSSIHETWDRKLSLINLADHQIQLLHFSTPQQFEQFIQSASNRSKGLFLLDYEYLGTQTTGIMLIEKYGLSKQAILVSSYFEDQKVRNQCERLGIGLIPKSMAGFVPVSVNI